MNTADYLRVTTVADNGAEVPRYTDFRAVIPLDEARQAGHRGVVTVRIEAVDTEVDISEFPSYVTSYLFEGDLPGVGVDSDEGDLFAAARKVLTAEGFRGQGVGWETDHKRSSYSVDIVPNGIRR